MNLLAIDTSGPVAGCAVMRDGKIVHTVAMSQGLTHSETIMPAVDRALEGQALLRQNRLVALAVILAGLVMLVVNQVVARRVRR